jgi:hypothetical protein
VVHHPGRPTTPTSARRLADASVDPTEAGNAPSFSQSRRVAPYRRRAGIREMASRGIARLGLVRPGCSTLRIPRFRRPARSSRFLLRVGEDMRPRIRAPAAGGEAASGTRRTSPRKRRRGSTREDCANVATGHITIPQHLIPPRWAVRTPRLALT